MDEHNETFQKEILELNFVQLFGLKMQKNTAVLIKISLFLILYLFFGAAIFYAIEYPVSQQTLEYEELIYNDHRKHIMCLLMNYTNDEVAAREMYANIQEHSVGLQPTFDKENKWSFSNSMIFSFTIITTIGYGTFSPTTIGGQMFVIVYGLFGIPATAIALSAIAERVLYLFTWLSKVGKDKAEQAFRQFDDDNSGELDKHEFYEAVKMLGFNLSQEDFSRLWLEVDKDGGGTLDLEEFRDAIELMHADVTEAAGQKKVLIITFGIIFWLGLGVLVFSFVENWRPDQTFYFLFVSLTTIGLGDFAPETRFGSLFLIAFAMVGLGLVAILLTLLQATLGEVSKSPKLFRRKKTLKNNIKQMRQLLIFSSMPEKELKRLAKTAKLTDPQTEIMKEGEMLNSIPVLLTGSVVMGKDDSKKEVLFAPMLLYGTAIIDESNNRTIKNDICSAEEAQILYLNYDEWEHYLNTQDKSTEIKIDIEDSCEDVSIKSKELNSVINVQILNGGTLGEEIVMCLK